MSDTTIQPAMTPEQWVCAIRGDWEDDVGEWAEDRHYRAAINLYGQPFGFTHEDVAMLTTLASPPDLPPFAPLLDLAARLAALLPARA